MYTTNKQQRSDVYTLQSIRTGKYISSLFSDSHNETFDSRSLEGCYTWNSLEAITKIKNQIDLCIIVKIKN